MSNQQAARVSSRCQTGEKEETTEATGGNPDLEQMQASRCAPRQNRLRPRQLECHRNNYMAGCNLHLAAPGSFCTPWRGTNTIQVTSPDFEEKKLPRILPESQAEEVSLRGKGKPFKYNKQNY